MTVDAVEARALVEGGRVALRAGDARAARDAADRARALFPEVPEIAGADDARLFADVAALRAEAALAGAGPYDEVDLRRLAARTPPDEPSAALLVRVLAVQGREAEALEVVERLRDELADRYGTDPSPVITQVHLALLRGELNQPAVLAPPRPPARVVLPAAWRRPMTALLGRERDVEALETALDESALVTIVATGGAGKTRLAAEVTRRAAAAGQGYGWSSWPACARPTRCCPPCSRRSAAPTPRPPAATWASNAGCSAPRSVCVPWRRTSTA
ncbi:AfsR/SARP family transcriptional regulator [Micromonospora sp. CA-246542]|uniref:AfsR/SARP family transcriptional regulator n=1 Tax=Micromonospora sp. CA-246542 TaxID=3239959 RepID=UPI003D94219C